MGANIKTYKLKPENKLTKIPNSIALIVYRIIPIGGLSFFLYESHNIVVLDAEGFGCFIILLNVAWMVFTLSIMYGSKYDFIELEESKSKKAWLDALNSNIVAWVKGNGLGFRLGLQTPEREKKDVQYEKERLATYLAGSRQGIPPPLSRRESLYLKTIYEVVVYITIRLACASPMSFGPKVSAAFDKYIIWSGVFLLLPSGFLIGRQLSWCDAIGRAARKIRKECQSIDVEKAGDTREQLEWWIEAILKEESDSDALAEERMEAIIAPIVRAIRS